MTDQSEQYSNPDEDEVVDVLYDVISRRSTVPNRVTNIEAEILQQRQDLAVCIIKFHVQ